MLHHEVEAVHGWNFCYVCTWSVCVCACVHSNTVGQETGKPVTPPQSLWELPVVDWEMAGWGGSVPPTFCVILHMSHPSVESHPWASVP